MRLIRKPGWGVDRAEPVRLSGAIRRHGLPFRILRGGWIVPWAVNSRPAPLQLRETATLTPYPAGKIPLDMLDEIQDPERFGGVAFAGSIQAPRQASRAGLTAGNASFMA